MASSSEVLSAFRELANLKQLDRNELRAIVEEEDIVVGVLAVPTAA